MLHRVNPLNSYRMHVSFFIQPANFGKGFLGPDIPSEVVNEFVEMCHQLRVLNFVRDVKIGMPITLRQYLILNSAPACLRHVSRPHSELPNLPL